MTTLPLGNAGMASIATDDFSVVELFAGDTPAVVTESFTLVDQNDALPAFTVVGRITGSNDITLCDLAGEDGSEVPFGITTAPALDVGGAQDIAIFTSGCFNPDALNWHSSFDTADKKRNAFAAKTNGAIKLRSTVG